MASIRTNPRQSKDPSRTVMWRAGGSRTGMWECETFGDSAAAARFRDLGNGHGQKWPPGWGKGRGFVAADGSVASESEKFPMYAHAYVGLLTDISDHTRINDTRFH
ncbi:hypothetical protein [Streptomyces sp. H34-S4]|uniref:hypothetical protein n=1 Tax=Streptomyces sp. H34-S4 TaxID=2996463 RepID=UPI00226EAEE6|nr:hypothetical protein [Streptomyces sp. H34-S4]MCY0935175.1 hypothetical protein [Streptomyces sp. H34-S4]